MNKTTYIRQGSLCHLKSVKDQHESLQYLKPLPQSALLVKSSSTNGMIRRKKTRTKTIVPEMPTEPLSNESREENLAKSCDTSPLDKKRYSLETQETIKSHLSLDTIKAKLEEKLKDIDPSDLQGKFDAYFAIFDLVIIADKEFGRFLSIVKDELVETLSEIHNSKVSRLNKQINMLKENVQDLKKDKESIITKLSVLSNENINLLKFKEELSLKCNNLEIFIKKCIDNKSNPLVIIEELQQKSEKIRELSNKLNELYKNEAKILKIADEFKNQGIDFEKVYEETKVERNFPELKLKKKNVPLLRINTLK